MAWVVIQSEDEYGTSVCDVVPGVNFDGELIATANHQLGKDCQCRPFSEINEHGLRMWLHCDPDHPGALSVDEWTARKQAAESAEFLRAVETADAEVKLPTF